MKAAIYSDRLRTAHAGVHPALERVLTDLSFTFDAKSLKAALMVDRPDVVMVGFFSVPAFLAAEHELPFELSVPCLVVGMTPAALFEDDAVRFGFGGAVSLGGAVNDDEVASEIRSCITSGASQSGIRRSVDIADARRTLGVLYCDQIDFEIGFLVSVGLADREIAATVHLAPQTVRNRVSAILDRSRLVNRTDLAIHHPFASVKLWEIDRKSH